MLTLSASAALLAMSARRTSAGSVEAGQGGAAWGLDNITDRLQTMANILTEQAAGVDDVTAARNLAAFLAVIRRAEGTEAQPDPYRVCYGYSHTVRDLSDHPAETGEWPGQRLPDGMCTRAGFGPGCISTAAGAYQIIKPTWRSLRQRLGLADFGQVSQDLAAVELIRSRGALADAQGGRLAAAVTKCRNEWASLPGNYAGQGQRPFATLAAWFGQEGGSIYA